MDTVRNDLQVWKTSREEQGWKTRGKIMRTREISIFQFHSKRYLMNYLKCRHVKTIARQLLYDSELIFKIFVCFCRDFGLALYFLPPRILIFANFRYFFHQFISWSHYNHYSNSVKPENAVMNLIKKIIIKIFLITAQMQNQTSGFKNQTIHIVF